MTEVNSIVSQQIARRAGRITRENLAAMKTNETLVKPTPQSFLKKLSDGLQEGIDYLTQLSTMTVRESSKCKQFGHVLKTERTKKMVPVCADCGCEITSVRELRTEVLRSTAKTKTTAEFWLDESYASPLSHRFGS